MSGHSKWATTKHRKAAQDAKRSALFSKLARNITVAAKEGGDPNPDNNASLAAAIEKAKGYSMPKDKIKTAIDKAFGSGKDAANYETVVYEGYGPAGVAVLCEALTDNRNRTAADVRAAFSHSGGNLGTSGSVAFQFDRKGQIMVSKEVETGDKKNPIGPNGAAADEEEFMLAVAEAGGDDYEDADEEWIVYTAPGDLMAVVKELEAQGVGCEGRRDDHDRQHAVGGVGGRRQEGHAPHRQAGGAGGPAGGVPHHGHHRRDRRGARRVVFASVKANRAREGAGPQGSAPFAFRGRNGAAQHSGNIVARKSDRVKLR